MHELHTNERFDFYFIFLRFLFFLYLYIFHLSLYQRMFISMFKSCIQVKFIFLFVVDFLTLDLDHEYFPGAAFFFSSSHVSKSRWFCKVSNANDDCSLEWTVGYWQNVNVCMFYVLLELFEKKMPLKQMHEIKSSDFNDFYGFFMFIWMDECELT